MEKVVRIDNRFGASLNACFGVQKCALFSYIDFTNRWLKVSGIFIPKKR